MFIVALAVYAASVLFGLAAGSVIADRIEANPTLSKEASNETSVPTRRRRRCVPPTKQSATGATKIWKPR